MAKRKPLKELPAELDEKKFEHLTESSKVSKFCKEEFEAYRNMYHKEWDDTAMVEAFIEDHADLFNAKVAESVSEKTREMAKAADKVPVEKIAAYSGLSVEEITRL